MSVNSRLKAITNIGQRKAFYRKRITELIYARKETVDIDIFVTSKKVTKNHAIYQNNE